MLTDRYVRIIRSQSNSEKWSNDALIVVFFKARTPTKIYTLSLHDALPIFQAGASVSRYGRRKSPYTMGLLTATSAKVIVRGGNEFLNRETMDRMWWGTEYELEKKAGAVVLLGRDRRFGRATSAQNCSAARSGAD